MPKKNKQVITPDGQGKVVEVYPIREFVLVELPEVGRREYHKDDLQFVEDKETLEKAASTFVQKHGTGGGCGQCNLK
jgi:hypothetical protein